MSKRRTHGRRYITVDELAAHLEWTPDHARAWLLQSGAGKHKGGSVVTSPALLVLRATELVDELLESEG